MNKCQQRNTEVDYNFAERDISFLHLSLANEGQFCRDGNFKLPNKTGHLKVLEFLAVFLAICVLFKHWVGLRLSPSSLFLRLSNF